MAMSVTRSQPTRTQRCKSPERALLTDARGYCRDVIKNLGIAGVAAFLVAAAGCGGGGAGPLAWPKGAGASVVSLPVESGELAVTAIPLARTANEAAVLLAARPQHPKDAGGLTIRYAASTGRGIHIGAARGWQPKRWELRPLAGFVIPPQTRAAVVIGAAAVKPGIYFLRGFIVDYRIGGKHYHAAQQLALRVCASVRSCP
jgi:hypothetical protein